LGVSGDAFRAKNALFSGNHALCGVHPTHHFNFPGHPETRPEPSEWEGTPWWRMKCRFGPRKDRKPGKAEKVLALGVYPDVSLKRAREKRDDARRLLADGVDPSAQRQAQEHAQRIAHLPTFKAVATAWMERNKGWTESHATRTRRRFEQHVFPWIGATAISEIKRPEVRDILRRIESTGRRRRVSFLWLAFLSGRKSARRSRSWIAVES
jgi:hypothetical protein